MSSISTERATKLYFLRLRDEKLKYFSINHLPAKPETFQSKTLDLDLEFVTLIVSLPKTILLFLIKSEPRLL